MSYTDGWAAINLEKPARVPRTEYSTGMHWELINAVTGSALNDSSSPAEKNAAALKFNSSEYWNMDFIWQTDIHASYLDNRRTDMGHAVYKADGSDRRDISACPFASPEEVFALDFDATYEPLNTSELINKFNTQFHPIQEANDAVCMNGIYITLISGLLEILGWDMFLMALGTAPEEMGKVANRYARWAQPFFNALADCDSPAIMVHDDIVWTSGPFVSPDWYREYVFPNYKTYLAPLKEAGKKITYTSDGDYTLFIDDIAECGVNGFVMEPTTDMAYVAKHYGKTHYFIGNADTRILLSGSKAEIRAEVERCMNIGKDCPGFFMAVGNHIPPNTPVENAIYYNEVYKELSRR
jgi:hypothetical protein